MYRIKRFLLLLLCLSFVTASLFSGCASKDVRFTLADLGNEVSFHTQQQIAYLENEDCEIIKADGMQELSRPLPVTLSWTAEPVSESLRGKTADEYVVEINKNKNMSDSRTYATKDTSLEIYNLEIGTEYFWKVIAVFGEEKHESNVQRFKTCDRGPRNLYVDGVTNVRDLGGYITSDGKKIKQGMIYRTARLNTSYNTSVTEEITEEGKRTMLNDLGVKTEIDLRLSEDNEIGGLTVSVLGEGVKYINIPFDYSVKNALSSEKNRDSLIMLFEVLAKEETYPVFFHCNIGTDRTGMVAYILGALLGEEREDLYRDYLFSNFGEIGVKRSLSKINIYTSYIDFCFSHKENELQKNTVECLTSFGVPLEKINKIQKILLK